MNCLLHAFQTVTGLDLVARLGHDGSEVLYPDLDPPMCCRGFHTQELIKASWPEFVCMRLEAWPMMYWAEGKNKQLDHCEWFGQMISESNGIVIGFSNNGIAHAEPCIDGVYDIDKFESVNSFIMVFSTSPPSSAQF